MRYAYQRRQITNDAGEPETCWVLAGVVYKPVKGEDGLDRFPMLTVRDGGRRLLKPKPITRPR